MARDHAALKLFDQLIQVAHARFHAPKGRRNRDRAAFRTSDGVAGGAKPLRQFVAFLGGTRGGRQARSEKKRRSADRLEKTCER